MRLGERLPNVRPRHRVGAPAFPLSAVIRRLRHWLMMLRWRRRLRDLSGLMWLELQNPQLFHSWCELMDEMNKARQILAKE